MDRAAKQVCRKLIPEGDEDLVEALDKATTAKASPDEDGASKNNKNPGSKPKVRNKGDAGILDDSSQTP